MINNFQAGSSSYFITEPWGIFMNYYKLLWAILIMGTLI